MLGGVQSLGPTQPDYCVPRVLAPELQRPQLVTFQKKPRSSGPSRMWGSAVFPRLRERPLGVEKAKPPAVCVAIWALGRLQAPSSPATPIAVEPGALTCGPSSTGPLGATSVSLQGPQTACRPVSSLYLGVAHRTVPGGCLQAEVQEGAPHSRTRGSRQGMLSPWEINTSTLPRAARRCAGRSACLTDTTPCLRHLPASSRPATALNVSLCLRTRTQQPLLLLSHDAGLQHDQP